MCIQEGRMQEPYTHIHTHPRTHPHTTLPKEQMQHKQNKCKEKAIRNMKLQPKLLNNKDRHMDKHTWVLTHTETPEPPWLRHWGQLGCQGQCIIWGSQLSVGCPDVPVLTVLCESCAPRGLDQNWDLHTHARALRGSHSLACDLSPTLSLKKTHM